MSTSKYDTMPLEKLKAAQQKAQAAGDTETVGMFAQVIKEHPDNLVSGYRKAKVAGDYDTARDIHRLYRGKKKPQSDADLYADPIWVEEARTFYKADEGKDFEGSDEEAAKWALSRIGQFNYNIPKQVLDAVYAKSGQWGDQGGRAFIGLLERADDLPNFTMDGTKRLIKGMATDWTNYLGLLGVGKVAAGKAGRAAARAAIMKQLSKGTAMEAGEDLVEAGVEGLIKEGVRSTTGAAALKAAGAGAGWGAAYGAVYELARQSVEQGAGSGEGYSIPDLVLPMMAGASLGGGVGSVVGARMARGNSKRIKDVRKSLEAYAAGGDMRTSVNLQRNAIDATGTADQQAMARRMYETGDVEGIDNLYQQLRKSNKVQMAGTEFNAGVVKGVNTEAMVRGNKALQKLDALHRAGKVDGYTLDTARSAFQAAKAPNSHYRAEDLQELIRTAPDEDSMRALSVLAAEAKTAAQTVKYRTIRGQQSRLREFLENPMVKVVADLKFPGGSTMTSLGGRIAEDLGRRMGVMAPTPTRMLTARGDATSGQIPDMLRKAYTQDAKRVGREIVAHLDLSRKVANLQVKPKVRASTKSTKPQWEQDAGRQPFEPTENKNGLATSAEYVGMTPTEYIKAIKELQASSNRPDIKFYGDELINNGSLPKKDFYKLQNVVGQYLVASGQRSVDDLRAARKAAEKGRKKSAAAQRVIAENARIETKIDQGIPLEPGEARKAVIIRATRAREYAKDLIAESDVIPQDLKGALRAVVDKVADAKSRDDKINIVVRAQEVMEAEGVPTEVQQEFIQIVKPVTQFGRWKT